MGMETGHQERNIMTSNEEMAEKLAEKFYGLIAVSYTHLTLPTKA